MRISLCGLGRVWHIHITVDILRQKRSGTYLVPRIYMDDNSIKSLSVDGYLWDDKVTGLLLRHYKSGRKSFLLKYRFAGVIKKPKIGDYGLGNDQLTLK